LSKYWTWFLLILCNLFWAGNFVFGKYVLKEMTPLWINFVRWALALLFLFPIAHLLEKPDWKKIWMEWPSLAILGILGGIVFNMLLYSALEYTSATNAALVAAINPGVIVLFSVLVFREKISRGQLAGFAISLFGVFAILTQGNLSQIFYMEYNRGDLLMVLAVLVWSLYSILGKRLIIPPITATAVSALFAVIIMLPFAIGQGFDSTKIGPLAIEGILYIAIFSTVCSFIIWNVSIRAIGAGPASVFLNLIPAFTVMISAVLGEKIMGAQVWGGVCVLIGVYLATGKINQQQKPKVAVPEAR
jgi:drug/metabolite transporter (DMT)-like permease